MQLTATYPANSATDRWAYLIPPSVLVAALFAFLHTVVWVLTTVMSGDGSYTAYSDSVSFRTLSVGVGILLFAYLGVDLWRWRTAHRKARAYGYVIFALAATLVAATLRFFMLANSIA